MRAFLPVALCGLLALTDLRAEEAAPIPFPPVRFDHLPWKNGEALTYLISLGGFKAAEATFTATKIGSQWEFKLALASRGLVDEVYPFTGTFWSILATAPWRSIEYGEYRFEPSRVIRERTRVDYGKMKATREMWGEGKTRIFPITQDSVDDVGTMLYHIRAVPWKPGDKGTLFVYENNSEKQGTVEYKGHENRAIGTWPKQPLMRLMAIPGKGTRQKGYLKVWMTDDARHLPLHADLDFRYGTFSIDLIKAENTLPSPTDPTPKQTSSP